MRRASFQQGRIWEKPWGVSAAESLWQPQTLCRSGPRQVFAEILGLETQGVLLRHQQVQWALLGLPCLRPAPVCGGDTGGAEGLGWGLWCVWGPASVRTEFPWEAAVAHPDNSSRTPARW